MTPIAPFLHFSVLLRLCRPEFFDEICEISQFQIRDFEVFAIFAYNVNYPKMATKFVKACLHFSQVIRNPDLTSI